MSFISITRLRSKNQVLDIAGRGSPPPRLPGKAAILPMLAPGFALEVVPTIGRQGSAG